MFYFCLQLALCGLEFLYINYLGHFRLSGRRVDIPHMHTLSCPEKHIHTCCRSDILIVVKLISRRACDRMLNILTCRMFTNGPNLWQRVRGTECLLEDGSPVQLVQVLIPVVAVPSRWIRNIQTLCFSHSIAISLLNVSLHTVSSEPVLTSHICFLSPNPQFH